MDRRFQRLVSTLQHRYDEIVHPGDPVPFGLRLAGGQEHVFGRSEPAFTLVAKGRVGIEALRSLDLMAIGEAYLAGALDVEGDFLRMLSLRNLFRDRHPLLWAWKFMRPLLYGQERSDAAWIAAHYDEDPDFYLLFLDNQHRCYSQGVFEDEAETLEAGIERKLEFAFESTGIRPGDRVLDVGGGWGAWTEFAGRRGVQVTSLTLSQASERFINALIERQQLPCRVLREHLFNHQPDQPYHAIVNLGVTEHLPDYARTLKAYARLLQPGGRVCLDASACRQKYAVSAFFERHIFPGNGSPVCLHDYLAQVADSPFSVLAVHNDTRNYELTTRHWAQRLDAHRELIERRWGLAQYRRFQVYLWGCVDGFHRDVVQAYRWVLELEGSALTAPRLGAAEAARELAGR